MDYSAEELLPVVAKLAGKYTSKESTSISYEAATMLTEAVQYCIRELEQDATLPTAKEKLPTEQAYEMGLEAVIARTQRVKERYSRMIVNFQDYNCRNYKDTLVNGMTEFFRRYDTRFCPQNHLLMLDYPTMERTEEGCGIDLIDRYLQNILTEQELLSYFPPEAVMNLLERTCISYHFLFLDNICETVLLQAVGCLIADKEVQTLTLTATDCDEIMHYFSEDTVQKAAYRITKLIDIILQSFDPNMSPEKRAYFQKAASGFANRIHNATKTHAAEALFSAADKVVE